MITSSFVQALYIAYVHSWCIDNGWVFTGLDAESSVITYKLNIDKESLL